MALMIVNKTELVTRFTYDKFPYLTRSRQRSSSLSGSGGYTRGHDAGSKMDIGRGQSGPGPRYLEN